MQKGTFKIFGTHTRVTPQTSPATQTPPATQPYPAPMSYSAPQSYNPQPDQQSGYTPQHPQPDPQQSGYTHQQQHHSTSQTAKLNIFQPTPSHRVDVKPYTSDGRIFLPSPELPRAIEQLRNHEVEELMSHSYEGFVISKDSPINPFALFFCFCPSSFPFPESTSRLLDQKILYITENSLNFFINIHPDIPLLHPEFSLLRVGNRCILFAVLFPPLQVALLSQACLHEWIYLLSQSLSTVVSPRFFLFFLL